MPNWAGLVINKHRRVIGMFGLSVALTAGLNIAAAISLALGVPAAVFPPRPAEIIISGVFVGAGVWIWQWSRAAAEDGISKEDPTRDAPE